MHLKLRVVDEDGSPVGGTVVEIWQANAAGRYIHPNDDEHAPVDRELLRRGAPRHRRDGLARAAHREARRLPGADQGRLVAPAAHPLLDLRQGVALEARDADVLPRRAAQRPGPHPQRGAGRAARERLVARLVPPTGDPANALVFEHEIVLRGRKATPAQP
jgi:protocatechuate 3,4-dioxygenase, beta subunit